MPRKTTVYSPDYPMNLGARANNREWFALPMEDVWQIFEHFLGYIHYEFDVRIHAFVLMKNHWHLIARFPLDNRVSAMCYLMKETSKAISKAAGRINHAYGRPHFRSSLQSNLYFEHAYKYLYRNPVAVKACKRPEDYPYSTLACLLGKRPLVIPLVEDTLLMNDVDSALKWLDKPGRKEDVAAVKRALSKAVFEFGVDRKTKKPHALETRRF